MEKKYNVEVDCPNCALKMEEAAAKVEGVVSASVHLMLQKMTVVFAEGADPDAVMPKVRKACRKAVSDGDILL